MYPDSGPKPEGFGGDLVDKVESEYHSITTKSEDKIYTEESVEENDDFYAQ